MSDVMLARAIYWMSRYIERAENSARFVDVNLQLTLDRFGVTTPQWMPLINITGDEEAFAKGYDHASRENVLAFLTRDPDDPHSIRSCVESARENARTIRETITTEMWQQINGLYHLLCNTLPGQLDHKFCTEVKRASMLFTAVTDNAMSRILGWDFAHLGRLLERADKTSRILDVKYFLLLPTLEDVGSNEDAIQWRALLHSTDALEMYRQKHGPISPSEVAGFLIFKANFPRSLAFLLPSLILIGMGTATGAIVLGIVIPGILLLITAMYFNDMGDPLFWPVFVLFMLLIGTGVGFVFSILWVLMFWLLRLLIPAKYRV